MAVQLHRRDPFLVLGHEVDGLKPHREGQLGGVEDGSCGDRGLAVAAIALLELAAVELAASVVATVRAQKPIGPSPLIQGVEALVFGAVEREECVEADSFLELHRVACHVTFLFLSLSYMAIFYTKCSLDSRVIRKKKAGKDAWKVNWWDTPELQAASDAIEEARHRSEAAAEGVRQTVDGEVAAAMIDAMKVAAEKMALAHNKMSTWFARPGTPPVDVVDTSRAARDATERAYRDSVKAFCDAR